MTADHEGRQAQVPTAPSQALAVPGESPTIADEHPLAAIARLCTCAGKGPGGDLTCPFHYPQPAPIPTNLAAGEFIPPADLAWNQTPFTWEELADLMIGETDHVEIGYGLDRITSTGTPDALFVAVTTGPAQPGDPAQPMIVLMTGEQNLAATTITRDELLHIANLCIESALLMEFPDDN